MSAAAKSRHTIAIFGIILLLVGVVLIGFGDQVAATLPHTYPASTLSEFKPYSLAITCEGNDNTVMDTSNCKIPAPGSSGVADTEIFRPDAWQLRWGSVDLYGSSFRWREYWYTTYRFEQKWATDYGATPAVWPYCKSGEDKNSDGSPCNVGDAGSSPAPANWMGYIATRTFKAGFSSAWPANTKIHVHAEFTFDDAIKVQVNILNNNQWSGWQTVVEQYTPNTAIGQKVLTWDKDLAAEDNMVNVRVIWAQYYGAALINNSWDFQTQPVPVPTACDLSKDIFSYNLLDGTHDAANTNIQIHSQTASYNVNPTFTVKAIPIQTGCAEIIGHVPVSLHTSGYDRSPNYQMTKQSDGSWQIQVGPLSAGTYYLNIGVETNIGTQWGLSVMKMSFVNAAIVNIQGGSGGNGNWIDWFTPIRDAGILFSIIGLVTVFYAFPMKKP